MEIRIIGSELECPKPRDTGQKATWRRFTNNAATRSHMAGRKLSFDVLDLEVQRLRLMWDQLQRTRYRYAVYEFLEFAYAVVAKFGWSGRSKSLLRKLRSRYPAVVRMRDSYAAILHLASANALDYRTRSKWSRVLRRAEMKAVRPTELERFIRRVGGLNRAC